MGDSVDEDDSLTTLTDNGLVQIHLGWTANATQVTSDGGGRHTHYAWRTPDPCLEFKGLFHPSDGKSCCHQDCGDLYCGKEHCEDGPGGGANCCGMQIPDDVYCSSSQDAPCTLQVPTPVPTPASEFCTSTAPSGAVGKNDEGCAWYKENGFFCTFTDDEDFTASAMCCECGGGSLGAGQNDAGGAPSPATSVSAFGDPHLKNIKSQSFQVRQPGVHTLLNVPQGAAATDVQLRVDASMEQVGSACSSLFIRRLDITGRWLGSVSRLGFSADVALPGEIGGAGFQVGNSSAPSIEEFISMVPSGMVKLTLPRKEMAAPSAANKHATLMTATVKLGRGVHIKVSFTLERTPSASLARSLWLSVTGLSTVREKIGGLLGLDDHFHASLPDTSCTHLDMPSFVRLENPGAAATASLE